MPTLLFIVETDVHLGCSFLLTRWCLQDACALTMEALRETNKFLQESEPWMRKAEEDRPYRLECVRVCLEAVYCLTHLLVPFIPIAGTRVFEKLGEWVKRVEEIK